MAKNNDGLLNSENNKMTESNNLDDDTEDYIQPSQPLSFQSPGVESASKRIPAVNDSRDVSVSTIDETLPFPKLMISTPFGDESRDFIPESENPVKRKIEIADVEESCKKRLNLDLSSLVREAPDMFSTQPQLSDTIDAAHLKFPQSPSKVELGNVSLVPESPPRINEIVESEHSYTMFSESDKRGVLEETTAEDSYNIESADLYVPDSSKNEILNIRKYGTANRTDDNVADEIITVDSSSRFIDDSEMTSLLRSDNMPRVEEGKRNGGSQETQLNDTIDAEDIKCYSPYTSDRTDMEAMSGNTNPPVSEVSTTPIERASDAAASTPIDAKSEITRLKGVLKNVSDEELARLQKHSTPENPLSKSPKINESASSIENGTPPVEDGSMKPSEISFTVCLQMDCQVVIDPHKGEPITKKIVNVKELLKRQPRHFFLEPNSDSSYKTKRLSSSSSGSVYSDKTGLPYALPNRSLPTSVNSSSSSVDLAKHVQIVGRQVWINEYKIPMALDEILPRYVEHHKLSQPPIGGKPTTKRKISMRTRKKGHWSHPLDNVLESSMTEQSSGNNSDDLLTQLDKGESPKPKSPKDVHKSPVQDCTKAEEEDGRKVVLQAGNILQKEITVSPGENESSEGIMSEGLFVFARWTDKRYYPGILKCKAKYDRWDVKFDDGTEKVIREDLILPLSWLTNGELVFALAADKYMSGKIADIIRKEDMQFKIELDDTNEEVIVKKCDICLNEVMAGIIREKFKPSNKTIPPLKSCDIDVDNVLTGKRVREQRTPIRGSTSVVQLEGSTVRKRKGGLRLSEGGSEDKRTPVKKQTPVAKREIQSEKKTLSRRKKGAEPSLPSGILPEVEDVPSTTEKTGVQSDRKTDGRKKRGRALKYDSDKPEISNKKSRKSETLTNKAGETPVKQRQSILKPAKIVGSQTESAIDQNVQNTEKADIASVKEPTTWKKPRKSQKAAKGEKAGSVASARPDRGKTSTAAQDARKKKKSA